MTTSNNSQSQQADDLNTRVGLLISQSVFLGLTLALLIVGALSLLLSTYGAQALPYVYIVVALVGAVAFYGFAEVQRRWTLIQVSTVTELLVALFLVLTWAGLVFAKATWLAFAAMVFFSLIIQIGFVILGGQAGRLLNVRQIKRYFPRIVAGFVVGFMIGGAIITPLQWLLGATENLILGAAFCAAMMLVLLLVTNARYHESLQQVHTGPQVPRRPLLQVLTNRFVIFIFLYQMLSAMASQLLDFMVMAAAGERFTGDLLTRFLGNYTFYLNLVDLLFLTLVAGYLLSKLGLRYGLGANPWIDILILVAIIAAGIVAGTSSPIFFWLVVIVRVMDITFTDGTTRTSINATYQALPAQDRVAVLTGVEGIGVPIALGLTGVVLLIFYSFNGITLLHIGIFTLIISLLWAAAGFLVFRDYAANLLKTMRRRALDPAELTIDGKVGLGVIEGLLKSGRVSDVRLALDVLDAGNHPSLAYWLTLLVESDQDAIQLEALKGIEAHRIMDALGPVQKVLGSNPSPQIRGAAIRAFCALKTLGAVETAVPYLDSPYPEERLGAAVGLLRYGSIPGIMAAGPRLTEWEMSNVVEDRELVAKITGEVEIPHFYQPLLNLLEDPNLDVQRAAITAAGQIKSPELLPLVIQNLANSQLRSTSANTLVAYGEAILPYVEESLSENWTGSLDTTIRLVRACRQLKAQSVISLMLRYIQHPSLDVRDQVLAVLATSDYRAASEDLPSINSALKLEAGQVYEMLVAQRDIGLEQRTELLNRALDDEIREAKTRACWLLAFMYESKALLRAFDLIGHTSGGERALAMEMVEVTLSSEHRALAFPLIDPQLDNSKRIIQLERYFSTSAQSREERLGIMIESRSGIWGRPWVRACAIYTAALLGFDGLVKSIEEALSDRDPTIRETAMWALSRLVPEKLVQYSAVLQSDSDPQVQRLLAIL